MTERKEILPRLKFSTVEKRKIVSEIEQGTYTVREAMLRYNIAHQKTLYAWISMYADDQSVSGKRPRYSSSVRNQAAICVSSGKLSIEQAIRKYGVTKRTIKEWLSDFAAKNPLMKEDKQPKVTVEDAEVQKQIRELQLKIAALETMIDVAEEHYKLDIRKKYGTKQQ